MTPQETAVIAAARAYEAARSRWMRVLQDLDRPHGVYTEEVKASSAMADAHSELLAAVRALPR